MKKPVPILPESKKISKHRREKNFLKDAEHFIDLKTLMPRTKIDKRKALSVYQRRKISGAMKILKEAAGGDIFLRRDFAPVKKSKSASEYIKSVGLPKFSKGVLFVGGSKSQSPVIIKNGALTYKIEDLTQTLYPLNALTEKNLRASIKKHTKKINDPKNISYLGTHGGKIKYSSVSGELDGEKSAENFEEHAVQIFSKYSQMSANGEKRVNGRFAAHPEKWGMVLLVEPKMELNLKKCKSCKNFEKCLRERKCVKNKK